MMRVLTFLALASTLILASCKPDRGTPCIDEEKMVNVLVDIHIAQAALVREPGGDERKNNAPYYENILAKHGVNEVLFDSAVAWYAKNPDLFEKLYAKVSAEISERKEALD